MMQNEGQVFGGFFHSLKNVLHFPLLVFKGTYHYWVYLLIFPGRLSKWKGFHAYPFCVLGEYQVPLMSGLDWLGMGI